MWILCTASRDKNYQHKAKEPRELANLVIKKPLKIENFQFSGNYIANIWQQSPFSSFIVHQFQL